jgi:hypothetical protein
MEKIKIYIENTGEEYSVSDRTPFVNSITVDQAVHCQSIRPKPKDHFGIGNSYDTFFETVTSIPISSKFYYPIIYSNTTLIEYRDQITIPDEVVKCINKGQSKILMVGPYEGWRPGFYTPIVTALIKKYNLNNDCFVIMSANSFPLSAFRTVHLNFWEMNTSWAVNQSVIQKGLESLSCDKDYKFICLNRRPHGHRFAAVTELLDYQSEGLLSFQKITDSNTTDDYYNWQKQKFEKHYPNIYQKFESKQIEKYLPLNLPKELDPYDMLHSNPTDDIYTEKFYKSFLHIITETFAVNENEQIFFSEKIFKPMVYLRPFIVIGQSNSLKYLRKVGYKTFSQWIDESYDEEPDNEIRLTMAINSAIDFISNVDIEKTMSEMQPTLIHNMNWIVIRKKTQLFQLIIDLKRHLNE